MINLPITLQTKAGTEYAGFITDEFYSAKSTGTLELFRNMLSKETHRVLLNIRYMLEDKEMERKYKMYHLEDNGWPVYKEANDKYLVLKHFSTRI